MSRLSHALVLTAAVASSIATSSTEPAFSSRVDASDVVVFAAPAVHSVDLEVTLPAESWGNETHVTLDVLDTDAVVSGHLFVDGVLVASDDTGLPSGQQTFLFETSDALHTACLDSGQTQGACTLDLRIDIEAMGTGTVDALWSMRIDVHDDLAEPMVSLTY